MYLYFILSYIILIKFYATVVYNGLYYLIKILCCSYTKFLGGDGLHTLYTCTLRILVYSQSRVKHHAELSLRTGTTAGYAREDRHPSDRPVNTPSQPIHSSVAVPNIPAIANQITSSTLLNTHPAEFIMTPNLKPI